MTSRTRSWPACPASSHARISAWCPLSFAIMPRSWHLLVSKITTLPWSCSRTSLRLEVTQEQQMTSGSGCTASKVHWKMHSARLDTCQEWSTQHFSQGKVFSTRISASWLMMSIIRLLTTANGCQLGMHATRRHCPADLARMWLRLIVWVNSSVGPRQTEMVWPSLASVTTVGRLVTGIMTVPSLQSPTQPPMEAATMVVAVYMEKFVTMDVMVVEVARTGGLFHLVLATHPPSSFCQNLSLVCQVSLLVHNPFHQHTWSTDPSAQLALDPLAW